MKIIFSSDIQNFVEKWKKNWNPPLEYSFISDKLSFDLDMKANMQGIVLEKNATFTEFYDKVLQ